MADKAISALTEATVINDADRFVLEQSGQAKQISGATMISEFAEALDGHGGIQSIDLVGGEGNVKTYRITFTDGTTYDYEVCDGESGNYAVVAGNLAPYSDASGATQSIPFLSQGTGRGNGSATVSAGNYCQLKKKLGNTVCVNQLVNPANYEADKTVSGVSFEKLADGRIKITVSSSPSSAVRFRVTNVNVFTLGHKYLFSLQNNYGAGKLNVMIANTTYSSIAVGSDNLYDTIWQAVGDVTQWAFIVNVRAGCATGTYYVRPISSDLDRWFGSTDRIPSDLLSHPENWGRYYAGSLAYNAGTLESADGTVLRSIRRNLWNENWGNGYFDASGNIASSSSLIYSKDFIDVIPNSQSYLRKPSGQLRFCYYDSQKNFLYRSDLVSTDGSFTIPSNCHFIRFHIDGATYGNNITISLYYPGESGYDQYYPFSVLAEVDTGSEVLRSALDVADEKAPDGTITRKVKNDIWNGTETWTFQSVNSYGIANFYTDAIGIKPGGGIGLQSNRFLKQQTSIANTTEEGIFGSSNVIYLRIKSSTASTVAALKTYLSNYPVSVNYELATPNTEQGTAFAENIPCNPVGSMSWENTKGIPQGAEIFYPYDYAGTLDSMLKALPSANGTYTFKATVANGKITYSWVAD